MTTLREKQINRTIASLAVRLRRERDEARAEAVRYGQQVDDLRRQRDSARDWAVHLENELARLEHLTGRTV